MRDPMPFVCNEDLSVPDTLREPGRPVSVARSAGSTDATSRPVVAVHRGDLALVDSLREPWDSLCTDEPFTGPAWVTAFLRAFAPGRTLLLATARVDGRLAAVLPLLEADQRVLGLPSRVLESAANVHSCRFDLTRAPGPEGESAASAILEHLLSHEDWAQMTLRDVPVDGTLSRLTAELPAGFRRVSEPTIASPWFELPEAETPWEEFLQQHLNGNFRRELRRRARKLEQLGTVALRRVDRADPEQLERFYALEAAGWKGDAGSAIALDEATRAFYDAIAAEAADRGALSLYFLELDGRAIAGHFGITHADRYFIPKVAYDEEFARLAPGQLLLNAVARDCQARGLRVFDFLGPTMAWKREWTGRTRPLQTLHLFRDSAAGRLAHGTRFGWKQVARNVAPFLRRPSSDVGDH